ncbi:hypothetical protein GQX74_003977 [Glossina fuscipes]|nr:hypothetical protein GQX74_003977 [Glossina fuscipes]
MEDAKIGEPWSADGRKEISASKSNMAESNPWMSQNPAATHEAFFIERIRINSPLSVPASTSVADGEDQVIVCLQPFSLIRYNGLKRNEAQTAIQAERKWACQ